ncbi:MAG TPA: hypothetical protein GXZ36_04525 [Firmicutes bacterium]|jgi:protein arginine kinase activator|nr:hypothetical protein [Bacillota bacterium]
MWCERCSERPATVHVTKIVNEQKTEMHLCEVCAQETGGDLGFLFEQNFSFPNLLAGLLNSESLFPSGVLSGSPLQQGVKCSSCGLTFSDFRQVGQLGCSECYRGFGPSLDPLLKRIHGSTVHVGKVPRRTGGKVRVRKEIEELRKKLQQAISKEAYEEAARIRDEIKAKEKEL